MTMSHQKLFRIKHGHTLDQVAAKIGLSASIISRYENGMQPKTDPTATALKCYYPKYLVKHHK